MRKKKSNKETTPQVKEEEVDELHAEINGMFHTLTTTNIVSLGEVRARTRCSMCGRVFEFSREEPRCPECGLHHGCDRQG